MTLRTPTAAVAVHPATVKVRDGAGCLFSKNAVTGAAAAPPLSLGANEKIKPTTRITPTAETLLRSDQLYPQRDGDGVSHGRQVVR
jgi:hypothetical protein